MTRQGPGGADRNGLWIRIALAVSLGALAPYAELAWKCRAGFEQSEACVWGKSYLSLTRWLEPLLLAPFLFLAFTVIAMAWRAFVKRRAAP